MTSSPPPGHVCRVLLVEDSPDDRAELRRMLLRDRSRHYEFLEAETVAGALAVLGARAGDIACVLLDHWLPDGSSVELLEALPPTGKTTPCPVVVLTGHEQLDIGRQVLRAGAQDFVCKAWLTTGSLARVLDNAVERWTMARELHASEARLQHLVQAIPQPVWVIDDAGAITYVNDRWRAYFGDHAPPSWSAMFHPDEAPALLATLGRWRERGEPLQADLRLRRGDGQYRWHQVNVIPIRDGRGAVTHGYGIQTDIHDRREAQARLQLALQASRTGIWTWDPATDAVAWSPECHAIHGLRAGEFDGTGAGFFALVHPDDRAAVERTVRTAIASRAVYRSEFRIVRPDGDVVWVENLGRLTHDPADPSPRMTGTISDINERKLAEQALRAALERAEQAIRARDQVVSLVSHDLRNPLNVLRLGISYLETEVDGETARIVDHMNRQAERMSQIIDELLDVSRLQGGQRLDLELRPTDLVGLTHEVAADFRLTHAGREIEVLAADAPLVGDWDSPRLRRVVANLLANALKYSPAGGPVRLSLRALDLDGRRWAELAVTDEGIGIPARDLDHVFEWFARARNARHARIDGTGVGLAGVRQIVEQHGGQVTVVSQENLGSTFTVRLPAPGRP